MRLDLGCGSNKRDGYAGVDIVPLPGVDHVLDIGCEALPFGDSSAESVRCSHVLEHVGDLTFAMNEIWRVCQPGAEVEIEVPVVAPERGAAGFGVFTDPTHRQFRTRDTFLFYCGVPVTVGDYGIRCRFEVVEESLSVKTDNHHPSGRVDLWLKLRAVK